VYSYNPEPNPLIEATKAGHIVSICAAESSSSIYPFLGDHVVRHWRDSTGDLFGEVRRLRHLRGSERPPLVSTFCRAGLRIIMGIGGGGFGVEEQHLWDLRDVQRLQGGKDLREF
jgi:hypothetical protein